MADGGSFLSAGVGEPSRRAFLELDRRLAGVQATIDALSPAHGDLTGLGDDDHPQYLTEPRGDARYANISSSPTITLSGDATGSVTLTNLSDGTLSVTVNDDSHNHTIANVDNLQTTLDGKAASSHTHSYVPTAGGTMTGELQVNARLDVGDGSNSNHEIRIYKADNNVSDHIQFYNGTTRMGEIGCEDTTWLRINQETATNIYTPRYIRADGGFFVDGSTYGITGSGAGYFNGNVEARSGNVVVTRPNAIMLNGASDNNHKIYSLNNADTALPWSDGPVMVGYSGWGFYSEQENVWRMGLRGNSAGSQKYGWYNCNLMVGTTPDDSKNTHRLRVEGDSYVTGISRANEFHGDNGSTSDPSFTFTSDTDLGLYRQGTNSLGFAPYGAYLNSAGFYLPSGDWFRTTGAVGWYNQTYTGGVYMTDSSYVRVYNSKGFRVDKNGGSNYDAASIFIDANPSTLSFHPGGQAPQFRVGYNNNTIYCRNYPDTGWCVLEADVIDRSSRKDKQDIADFRNSPSALSSDGDPTYERSGLDIAMALRPRHYRWDWHTHMRQLPTSPRRDEALQRLNRIRENKGLEPFESDELWHECGRDCNGTPEEPCWWVKDWQTGYFGFVAEEVGEVAPEATRFGEENDHTGVKTLAVTAIAIAAIQELTAKVEQLEEQLQGAA